MLHEHKIEHFAESREDKNLKGATLIKLRHHGARL